MATPTPPPITNFVLALPTSSGSSVLTILIPEPPVSDSSTLSCQRKAAKKQSSPGYPYPHEHASALPRPAGDGWLRPQVCHRAPAVCTRKSMEEPPRQASQRHDQRLSLSNVTLWLRGKGIWTGGEQNTPEVCSCISQQ